MGGSQVDVISFPILRQNVSCCSAIPGGASQTHVSILPPVMGEPSTRHREVSGILEWSRERKDQCRGGSMVGAEAHLRVRGYVRKSRDVRAAKNDDR